MRSDDAWIPTYTGKTFYPLDPRPEDICIEDIAHHLSQICRYAGATDSFYSVAQHCFVASHVAEKHGRGVQRWALLHDAAEAYTNDLSRPLKTWMHVCRPFEEPRSFREIEDAILSLIATVFDLDLPMPTAEIEEIDRVLLAVEGRDLLRNMPSDWHELYEQYDIGDLSIVPWDSPCAERLFLTRFQQLFPGYLETA